MRLEEDRVRLGEQVERWIATIKDGQSRVATDGRVLDTPDWWKPEGLDPEVEKAINGFRLSNRMLADLGESGESAVATGNAFVVPLGVILDLLPPRYVQTRPSEIDCQRPVQVYVDDLFAQLGRGRVMTSVARLVFTVPVGFVSSMALRDTETQVTLPLALIVASIGEAGLATHMPGRQQLLNLNEFPELFTPGDAAAPATSAPPAATPVVAPEAALDPAGRSASAPPAPVMVPAAEPEPQPVALAVMPEPPPAVAPVVEPVESAPPAPAYVSALALDRLNGIELNAADEQQLRTLPGVTARVAAAILAYRRDHGPFVDVFALASVPGIGRETFRKITGMPFSRTGRLRGEVLARCLSLPPASVSHLPSLVRAIAGQAGLTGCVVSDREGLLLAESGVGEEAAAWSAVIPRLFAHLSEDLALVDGGAVGAVSLRMGGRFVTLSVSGNLFLTSVHASSRLSSRLQGLLRRVTCELAWLLSHRGYVRTPGTERAHD